MSLSVGNGLEGLNWNFQNIKKFDKINPERLLQKNTAQNQK